MAAAAVVARGVFVFARSGRKTVFFALQLLRRVADSRGRPVELRRRRYSRKKKQKGPGEAVGRASLGPVNLAAEKNGVAPPVRAARNRRRLRALPAAFVGSTEFLISTISGAEHSGPRTPRSAFGAGAPGTQAPPPPTICKSAPPKTDFDSSASVECTMHYAI